MLDPRAPEHEIAAVARHYVGLTRAVLSRVRAQGAPADALAREFDRLAVSCQARPVAPAIPLSGRITRMLDVPWWVRNLRRELCRSNEVLEHSRGRIRRSA